jgi:histidinol-phosphate aminotransferase
MARTPTELVRPEILALKAYHVADAEGMVKLDAMENPYAFPEDLRARLAERLARVELNRYPEPTGRLLRARLAEKMAVPAGMELLLGNGSDDLIQIVTLTLARPGAAVLFPEPTFAMYRANAVLSGMRPVGVPLREDLGFDAETFVARVRAEQPALVYLAYPNNPTGVLYDDAALLEVLRAAEGLVVLDEAYHAFARRSLMPRLAEFPNLVVMRTISKLGFAGIRLGYLAARPEWVREFNKVRQAYNVNALTQAVARLPGVRVFPSEANFLLVRVPDAARSYEGLRRQGVLVRNFHGAHPLLAQCLRITVGTPEENRILLRALKEVL